MRWIIEDICYRVLTTLLTVIWHITYPCMSQIVFITGSFLGWFNFQSSFTSRRSGNRSKTYSKVDWARKDRSRGNVNVSTKSLIHRLNLRYNIEWHHIWRWRNWCRSFKGNEHSLYSGRAFAVTNYSWYASLTRVRKKCVSNFWELNGSIDYSYDHETEKDWRVMTEKEEEVIQLLRAKNVI